MKSKDEEAITRCQKSLSLNNPFMLESKTEEIKHFAHNKKRYISALNEIGSLTKNMPCQINILDIGTSPFTFILRKKFRNAQIYSVDYTKKFERACKLHGIHFKKVDLNKQKISFGETKFNLITFLEVIEHLKIDGKQVIGHIADLMNPGGYCILQTPNKYTPKRIIANILTQITLNRLFKPSSVADESVHFREYSLDQLSSVINQVKKTRVIKKEHSIYFDEIDSASVYRKYPRLFQPLIFVNYFIVKNIPFLRRGTQIIFQKVD